MGLRSKLRSFVYIFQIVFYLFHNVAVYYTSIAGRQSLKRMQCKWGIHVFSILVPLGRNVPQVKGLEVEHWANTTKTVITWDQKAINASHVDIEISLFDTFEYRLHEGSLASFKRVPNSGIYHLDFSKENISPNTK